MRNVIKNKITLENLMCFFVCICPVLDIISFLFRNYFETQISPSTVIRPIIPCIVFGILLFKEKNKKQKITIITMYAIYGVIHLILFQKIHNESSYGNLINEIQYIMNYSIMIINLYLFSTVVKNREKIYKTVFISLSIYMISLFFSIITKTSTPTYIEKIGYKGYFESGNSLCTVLLLGLCIILSNIDAKEWKKWALVILIGTYLMIFSGMRTGLFGFGLVMFLFVLAKIGINLRDKIHFNKKIVILTILVIILSISLIAIFGSKTIERRRLLKQNETSNIDKETLEQRYVTGDILDLYKSIQDGEISEDYMSQQEKQAIIELCEIAQKIKLSNINLRAQQFIYNVNLVKQQKSPTLILFGNGYKNQTGELVMEMEIPALICNFGLIGFILYFGPFLTIFMYGIFKTYKNRKNIETNYIMYLVGTGIAIALSTLSGYVYFNFSSMTMAIILTTLLNKVEK